MKGLLFIAFLCLCINTLQAQEIKDKTKWHQHLNGTWDIEMKEKLNNIKIWGTLTFKENNVFECQIAMQVYKMVDKTHRRLAMRAGLLIGSTWFLEKDSSIYLNESLINCRCNTVVSIKEERFEALASNIKNICAHAFGYSENSNELPLVQAVNKSMISYFSPTQFIIPYKNQGKKLFSIVFTKQIT